MRMNSKLKKRTAFVVTILLSGIIIAILINL